MAIEPAPADPEAASPLWAGVAFMALFVLLTAGAAKLASRHRGGFLLSAAAAAVALVMAAACPASGHHAVGAWWYGQMAGFSLLGAASLAGYRRA